ncbi:MAG TPA: hypothetical protein VIK14_02115, partial [Ignavibacteria bacterium]
MNAIDFDDISVKCKKLSFLILLLIFLFVSVFSSEAQQVADTTYKFFIYQAAFQKGESPVIYIDEAHNNFHTKGGRFFAFSKLLEQDGYRVKRQNEAIMNADMLNACKILVIANPLHVSNVNRWTLPTPSAFSTDEISNIKQWVENGGSLFLIADHMPFSGAAYDLSKAFGFEFINGFSITGEGSWPPSVFTFETGTLQNSPVTSGIKDYEKIDKV